MVFARLRVRVRVRMFQIDLVCSRAFLKFSVQLEKGFRVF